MLPPPGKAGEAASVLVDADQLTRGYHAPVATVGSNRLTINQRAQDCKG